MNDLTGAFLIAHEKKENIQITRQSLANAGYPVQEIEQALNEARQLISEKNLAPIEVIQPKKKKRWLLFLIIFLVLAIISSSIFFFWENISSLFGGI